MIDADAMAIHFNPLQEAIQPEGDVNFKGLNILKEIISNYNKIHGKIPFIAKQVGEGFSKKDAIFLKEIGFDAIDVGGSGGTSWAAVELYRIKDEEQKNFSNQYFNWGIPTAASILEVNSAFSGPIIATGGIRTGIDIAKSISIGANCCGTALPILKAALKSSEAVTTVLERMIKELKTTMFLTGCNNINELKSARYILKGDLKNWKDQI
jgi:isopentenyl-diphosphate delta-isomerase